MKARGDDRGEDPNELAGEARSWLDRFASLNVAPNPKTGPAPHKPLLLLTVLDMVEDGSLRTPELPLSPELFARFQGYCDVVLERRRVMPDLRMPFHALGSRVDRVLTTLTDDGAHSTVRATTRRVCLDPGLWLLMQDPVFRRLSRERLVTRWFEPHERIALAARLELPMPADADVQRVKQQAAEYKASVKKGRDARFRMLVLTGYGFRCALTGYRLSTECDHMVEAAHIHAHADSGNDDPRNGMALTPDAHWTFDRGLWTAEPGGESGFVVVVATGRFDEASPMGRALKEHQGRELHLPVDAARRPDPKYFAWHRRYCFGR